ncbi:hypothetical protein BGZ76_002345 [Entomortierella beljakovae]|nr:hypothetical protein BGZ76_002345 [Entomortierella beljakovae]
MNSTTASSARKTSRNSIEPVKSIEPAKKNKRKGESSNSNAEDTPEPSHSTDPTKTIQQQKDEIEELNDSKTQLQDKITQLEERTQYLEATARLSASKAAAEIVEIKEKVRRLEIELSTTADERDVLEQEVEEQRDQTEVKDEARQISIQLKDAWLRIATMKSSQEDMVKKLYKSEEANAKLREECAKAKDASTTTKSELADEKKRWEAEKNDYIDEIESYKKKLSGSVKDGGSQLLEWEQEKSRLKNNFNYEKEIWGNEKKGLMDQIASLKIKATTLGMQKIAPPEWILEKHRLGDQITSLQSRVVVLESEKSSGFGSGSKKLEAEKLKLEKKVETLKAKLVELMQHAVTMQAEAESKPPAKKQGATPRRRPISRRKRKDPESDDEVVVVVADEENATIEEIVQPKTAPLTRETRAKRTAAVKNVNYQIDSDSSSSDQIEEIESEEEDEDEEEDETRVDEDEDEIMENMENEASPSLDKDQNNGAADTEMQEPRNETQDTAATTESIVTDQDSSALETNEGMSELKKVGRPKKKNVEESSDSEFEPPMKTVVVKSRSRRRISESPSVDSIPKKAKTAALNKKRSNETETSETTGSSSAKGKNVVADKIMDNTEPSTPDAKPSPSPSTSSSIANEPAKRTTFTVDSVVVPIVAEKTKKKRKLLTGKGLGELGDILNGPGSSLSSTPSTGLLFDKNKAHMKNSGPSLLKGTAPNPARLEALNAIKKAFSLPKPRTDSSTHDKEM